MSDFRWPGISDSVPDDAQNSPDAARGRCAAVLLLAFNRPDTTRKVLSMLARVRPERLYIATDGPRAHRPEDLAKCQAVRALAEDLGWPCQLRTLHRTENLGCALAVHSAITWFFEHESEGIILEDDCLAHPSFFRFCSELLARFRDNPQIFAISGDNFVEAATPEAPSYWFNRVFHCWGWASWRDRWRKVPPQIEAANAATIAASLRSTGLPRQDVRYWTGAFSRVATWTPARRRLDTWDYQACHHALTNNLLTVCPARNLVTNIGFGPEASHTRSAQPNHATASTPMVFPLQHPATVVADSALSRETMRQHFGIAYWPWPLGWLLASIRTLARRSSDFVRRGL